MFNRHCGDHETHNRHHGGRHGRHGHGRRPDLGGRGLRGARMTSAADLQLIILALLGEKPRHGYEIIKAVQERSNGFYAPSAGMVYPALTFLYEIGHATVATEGAKKLYSLTDLGRTEVEQNRERIAALFSELSRFGRKMERAQRAYEGDGDVAAEPGGLEGLRRDLKAALFDAQDAPADEQARVGDILRRALAEIRRA
jgi:DNA-binding PadR family transcriptional regulator